MIHCVKFKNEFSFMGLNFRLVCLEFYRYIQGVNIIGLKVVVSMVYLNEIKSIDKTNRSI
jgi:hypothetical protein